MSARERSDQSCAKGYSPNSGGTSHARWSMRLQPPARMHPEGAERHAVPLADGRRLHAGEIVPPRMVPAVAVETVEFEGVQLRAPRHVCGVCHAEQCGMPVRQNWT